MWQHGRRTQSTATKKYGRAAAQTILKKRFRMQKTIAYGTFSASFSGTAEKEMQKMKKRKELMKAAAVQARREQTAQRLSFAACADVTTCLTHLHSRITGLTEEQVDEHRAQFGANRVTHEKAKPLGARIVEAFINPFTAILLCNHSPEEVSPVTVVIILTMVIISGTLRFVQESRSGHAAEKLLAMITTTCTVTRKPGGTQELALEELVVGDIIHLSAGDMVPADVRILEAKDLFISQSAMTGESDPVEKFAHSCEHTASVTDCSNLAFMGTNVISGAANAVVVAVRRNCLLCGLGTRGNKFHEGCQRRFLGAHSLHAGDDSHRVFCKRLYKARLGGRIFICHFRGRGLNAGNAAHDCHHLPCERRGVHVAQKDHCQKLKLHSGFWCNGHSLHRQNRHAHAG